MISLGLSSGDLVKFQLSLITGYNLAVTVQVLDLNHNKISDISSMLVDGQVNKSYWEWITSGATLTLLDPDSLVGFDTQSPSDGALYADRMIRITYSVFSDLLPRWVHVPLFTGPVTKVSRDDATLSVECQGKESLYMAPSMAWTTKTYPKGMRLTTAIRDILGNKGGETRFDLPEWTSTLSKDQTLRTETPIWQIALWMSGSRHTRQLFYDAWGVVRLRARSPRPTFTFTESHLASEPKLDYDIERIRNTVLVKGGTPEGKPQITAVRYLPSTHPSSAKSLGRNGVWRPLVEVVEDPSLMSQLESNNVADDTLGSVQLGDTSFDFDVFPVPHLEPGDAVHLSTRLVSLNLLADRFSIPLRAGVQSMGDHRRISANVRRLRRR